MKRVWWLFGSFCLVTLVAGIALRQPQWLQRVVIERASKRIQESTPYELSIASVRWNIFSGLNIGPIELRLKKDHTELFRARFLQIHLEWIALFHKQLRVTRLSLIEPTLLIPLGDSDWLPKTTHSQVAGPLVTIQRIDIVDGIIRIRKHRADPSNEVAFTKAHATAKLSANVLTIDQLGFRMGSGRVSAEGDLRFQPAVMGRLQLDTEQLPLERLVGFYVNLPRTVRLTHSGHLIITGSPLRATLMTTGRLSGSSLSASGVWRRSDGYEADMALSSLQIDSIWPDTPLKNSILSAQFKASGHDLYPNLSGEATIQRPGAGGHPDQLVRAQIQWIKGQGPIQLTASYGGLTAEATGQANIRRPSAAGVFSVQVDSIGALGNTFAGIRGAFRTHGHFSLTPSEWSINGEGSGRNGLWQAHSMKSIEWDYKAIRNSLTVHWKAQNIQILNGQKSPWDLDNFEGTVTGWTPHWNMISRVTFQNQAALDLAGPLVYYDTYSEFRVNRLRLNLPSGGDWNAFSGATLSWNNKKELEVRNLIVTQESHKLVFHNLFWSPSQTRADLSLHLDPSAFNDLMGGVEFSKGSSLDADWKAQGTASAIHSSGMLTAHADKIEAKSVGLSLEHWNCVVTSTDRSLDVDNCSAKTSTGKGDVMISGHSVYPQLQLSLRGKKLMIHYEKAFQATATLALDLKGTLGSPELKGHLHFSQATYSPPKDAKKSSTPTTSTPSLSRTSSSSIWRSLLLDVMVNWPRDVWYRQGSSSIETRGDMRIQKSKGETDWRTTGTVSSIRGNYSYLGRNFSIEHAQLQFPNTSGFDPLLNIEASYPAEAIVVYLDVTGSIEQPVLKLRSSPPLSDQDIISVIAFGQPISELRSSGNGINSNQQMEAAAGSVLGSYITNKLQESGLSPIQLDVFDVQPTAGGNQLTIGRYLTRRLFVSYGQTLQTSPGRALTGDYFLTDRWLLQAETGTTQGNYLDLLFRYPLNGNSKDTASSLLRSPFRNTLDQPTGLGQPVLPAANP